MKPQRKGSLYFLIIKPVNMKEFFLMLTSLLPKEDIFNQLAEAVEQHKILGTKETGDKVEMYCHMYVTKSMTDKEDVTELISKVNRIEQFDKQFTETN